LLAIAATVALVVRAMRRHRRDDYRGRYRAWGWLAGLLVGATSLATHAEVLDLLLASYRDRLPHGYTIGTEATLRLLSLLTIATKNLIASNLAIAETIAGSSTRSRAALSDCVQTLAAAKTQTEGGATT
jgi:hypothetical protein